MTGQKRSLKALVIGASGLVGHALAAALEKNDFEVIGTYQSRPVPRCVRLDIREAASVRSCVESAKPTLIFLAVNAAGGVDACEVDPEGAHLLNVTGTQNVVEAAIACGAKVVYYSTDYIFDGRSGPYSENEDANPVSIYGYSKWQAEQIIRRLLPLHLILRTTAVFGWDKTSPNFAMQVWEHLQVGTPMRVPNDQWCNPTLVDYLAEVTVKLVQMGIVGVLNVVGKDRLPRHELGQRLARAMALDPDLIQGVPTAGLRQKAQRPLQGGLQTGELERVLGAAPLDLAESLERFRRHWRADTHATRRSPDLSDQVQHLTQQVFVPSWGAEFEGALRGRRFLVTGATGFLGRHLCAALRSVGAEVDGLARSARSDLLATGCRCWAVDLRDIAAARQALAQIKPDFIFHLAGMVMGRQEMSLVLPTVEHNLLGSIHMLVAAAEAGCERFVLAGSSEEPLPGEQEDGPASPYAAAKAAAMYARMFYKLYALPVVTVRLFATYGPWQSADKLIPYAIRTLLRGESPRVQSAERLCDFIYVSDVVRGLLKAAVRPGISGATLELGTGRGTKIREMVELLAHISGSAAKPVFAPLGDRIQESNRTARPEPTRQRLDWEPVWPLQRGLSETVESYRAQGEGSETG